MALVTAAVFTLALLAQLSLSLIPQLYEQNSSANIAGIFYIILIASAAQLMPSVYVVLKLEFNPAWLWIPNGAMIAMWGGGLFDAVAFLIAPAILNGYLIALLSETFELKKKMRNLSQAS